MAYKEKRIYDNDLSDPKAVLSGYIKSLVHGDVNQALYYISGNRKKVDNYKVLGICMEGKAQEKAESIIRKEKNLPMELEKFKVYLKKNEYGWVFDSLNDENEKLNDFIDRS